MDISKMGKIHNLRIVILFRSLISFFPLQASIMRSDSIKGWKAGVAKINITPTGELWMGGYGFRTHPSEGEITSLWAKALSIEDESGNQAVLITLYVIGISKSISDSIRDRLEKKYNLSRSQVILNASHTHSGPAIDGNLFDIYPMDSIQWENVKYYSRKLEDMIVDVVGRSLISMVPVKLFSGNGVTRFQVNRRNNNEQDLEEQTELRGPNDYAVPVLKIVNQDDRLLAIAFGYACHGTVLRSYKWNGDYMGFAQIELEKSHPEALALFFQGAGGDQNPLPRSSFALARQYGCELACSVERVLNEKMKALDPILKTVYSEIELKMKKPLGKNELQKKVIKSSDYEKRWAQRLLGEVKIGKILPDSYLYPMEVWKLGNQLLIALGGEPTVEYAIQMKRLFGPDSFILGYSNDVMSYIPTSRMLKEGGYEGSTSQMAYGLPSPWKSDIENRIIVEITELAGQVGVVPIRIVKKKKNSY
jgi:hypothetical protein